eukprot:GDKJ01028369.1.p1 GENE.GDKJ01028369.1~~GDKJ01028369.1.p1  ORF type:complete len:229 (-),score=45.96 GDKJ01028369.1:56-742(-)
MREYLGVTAAERGKVAVGAPVGGSRETDKFLIEELVVSLAVRRVGDELKSMRCLPSDEDALLQIAEKGWSSQYKEVLRGTDGIESLAAQSLSLAYSSDDAMKLFESAYSKKALKVQESEDEVKIKSEGISESQANTEMVVPNIDLMKEGDALNMTLVPVSSQAREPIDVYKIWVSDSIEDDQKMKQSLKDRIVKRSRNQVEAPSFAAAQFGAPTYPWASSERSKFQKP